MDLYRQEILDHYKHPHNFGHLHNANAKHTMFNSACGDVITMELVVKKDKKDFTVKKIQFTGDGCAVSKASASLLTDLIKHMSVKNVMNIGSEKVYAFFGGDLNPSRIKCALLPLETVQKALLEWQKQSGV